MHVYSDVSPNVFSGSNCQISTLDYTITVCSMLDTQKDETCMCDVMWGKMLSYRQPVLVKDDYPFVERDSQNNAICLVLQADKR